MMASKIWSLVRPFTLIGPVGWMTKRKSVSHAMMLAKSVFTFKLEWSVIVIILNGKYGIFRKIHFLRPYNLDYKVLGFILGLVTIMA